MESETEGGPPPLLPIGPISHPNSQPIGIAVADSAVTDGCQRPSVVGVPVIRPLELSIERPGGSPVALNVSVLPPLSVALIWTLTAVPTVPVRP
jgi:hypothetical protein